MAAINYLTLRSTIVYTAPGSAAPTGYINVVSTGGNTWTNNISINNGGFSTLTGSTIGIGSTTPGYSLDVAGIVQGQTAFQSNTNANNVGLGPLQQIYLGQYGAAAPRGTCVRWGDILGAAYYATTGSTNLSFYKDVSGGNAALAFQLVGTSLTNATPNVYIPNSVGVGTNAPGENMTVYGASNPAIGLHNSSTGYFQIGLASGSGNYSTSAVAGDAVIRTINGNLMLQANGGGSAGIYINTSNLVGIGTVSPVAPLHIYGYGGGQSVQYTPLSLTNSSAASYRWDFGPNWNGDCVFFLSNAGAWLNHTNAGGGWNYQSDIRLKDDITTLSDCLTTIQALRPVSYRWKSNMESQYKTFGLIAQEVLDVIPDIVSSLDDATYGKIYGITYNGCIPFLIGAIKELNEKNNTQAVQIASLETSLATIAARLAAAGIN